MLQTIKILLRQRNTMLKNKNAKGADTVQHHIIKSIKKNYSTFEVDFIIETLTHLGFSPNLMYDDNGLFALCDDGYQPVVTGNDRTEGPLVILVKKAQWQNTIRKAVLYYLNEL